MIHGHTPAARYRIAAIGLFQIFNSYLELIKIKTIFVQRLVPIPIEAKKDDFASNGEYCS